MIHAHPVASPTPRLLQDDKERSDARRTRIISLMLSLAVIVSAVGVYLYAASEQTDTVSPTMAQAQAVTEPKAEPVRGLAPAKDTSYDSVTSPTGATTATDRTARP